LIQTLAVFSQQWIPDTNKKYALTYPPGADGVCLLAVHDTLYLGGHFLKVDTKNTSMIARYYNGQWDSLKGGLQSANPYALSYNYNDGNLYAEGGFLNADGKPGTNGLARWDGNNWWPIRVSSNCASCYTMEQYDNKVFFGGGNMLGLAWGVIAWDGTNWVNRCNLPVIGYLKKYNSNLLAGYTPGGFIKYEGDTSWSSDPYGGIYGDMYRAEWDTINNLFYVSGDFNYVNLNNPIESHYIAIWDGFEWHSMGNTSEFMDCLKLYNGYLYAGLSTDTLNNGTVINYIGRWDGLNWQPLGIGLNSGAEALEEFHDTLFVTGLFTTAGGDSAYGLARWYMPDTNCAFLKPTIHTLVLQDTFYLSAGHVNVQFFNNNAYAQTWQWNFGDNGTGNTQNPIHNYTNDSAYTITVTVSEDGCTKSDTINIWVLNENKVEQVTKEKLQFKIYPNPTTGDFTIECTLPNDKTGLVKAYRTDGSELGRHSLKAGLNNINMPASNWKSDIILCQVIVNNKPAFTEKVIKVVNE